ncbi:MAG: hypothetical protein KGK01_12800 [Bradyrhizobium sp.]|uniref:hypothetical protein n=1 Tax=Bradyrhizobium sp. TaxID=376 RepID=UPI001C293F86|nr:hypothetical protein [Bradyrhizobium sp.]MBU6462249.1 hypothetical protein [Pseudomonadota bacterium]MDE2067302.1 hypothetical protein [Bradyrhizobium sp.]MDE2243277.1 hypothetical protein [Bradyrhizobium sp.]MDE2471947.1 hypothetical protein [Bradyrhizobium sp.]
MSLRSNDEFFADLRNLIDAWCKRRSLRPLSRILGPYLAFNGMTDGWAELARGLESIRAMDRHELISSEYMAIDELIRKVDRTILK